MAKVMHNQQQNQDLNISFSGTICVLYSQGAYDYQREGACDPTTKCCDPCCIITLRSDSVRLQWSSLLIEMWREEKKGKKCLSWVVRDREWGVWQKFIISKDIKEHAWGNRNGSVAGNQLPVGKASVRRSPQKWRERDSALAARGTKGGPQRGVT